MTKCRKCKTDLTIQEPVTVSGHYSTTDGGTAYVYLDDNRLAHIGWAECEDCAKAPDSRTSTWLTQQRS